VSITNPSAATQPIDPEPQIPNTSGSNPTVADAASIAGANAGDFTITGNGCFGQTLEPGQSCTIELMFAPSALGSRAATLDIPWSSSASLASAAQASSFTVALNGTGAEPTVTNTVTTPGTTTTNTTTITKTVTKKVTCTITVSWKWVTVKVRGKKKREHKKVTTRSRGCKTTAKKAAKPSKKHGKKHKTTRGKAGKHHR
jgi:hypothetical protein